MEEVTMRKSRFSESQIVSILKGFRWNHKRVYRIYRSLELNLRIKPEKRLIQEKPAPLRYAG